VNSRRSPQGVLLAHPLNKITQAPIDFWVPYPISRLPTPENLETSARPTQDGRRLNLCCTKCADECRYTLMRTKKPMQNPKSIVSKRTRRKLAPKPDKGKFTVRRIVNWGDCDPAGFIYTPRVLDYACETIAAWFREELNASWWQLKSSRRRLGLPTVNAVCDFISILRPDQSMELNLYIREIGQSSIVFEIEGLTAANRLAFRVKLVSCAIDMLKHRATRIPDWMRKELEAYKKRCA
jgi:4-hydroxybenzoyl-CoA thioesterase